MKRITSFIIVVLILLLPICSSMAETKDIVLPGGLEFGMPLDVAAATSHYTKESASRSEELTAKVSALGFDPDYLSSVGSIGGHQAYIEVYFLDGKLKQVFYRLERYEVSGSKVGADSRISDSFKSVNQSLIEKYGNPVATDQANHEFGPTYTRLNYRWYWTLKGCVWDVSNFGSSSLESTFIVPQSSGGTVYIDNYYKCVAIGPDGYYGAKDTYYDTHFLVYTYYDFQIDQVEHTNDVDF